MLQMQSGNAAADRDESAYAQEFLTFTLGQEEYAIDILKVQEIRGYDAVTAIAGAPEFIKGVINLRGTIVPIVDLRIKFGLGKVEYTPFTVVIILHLEGRIVGIVVDSVSDVTALRDEQISPAPDFGSVVRADHIRGLASVDQRMLIVVDIAQLMLAPDMALTDAPVQ